MNEWNTLSPLHDFVLNSGFLFKGVYDLKAKVPILRHFSHTPIGPGLYVVLGPQILIATPGLVEGELKC